MDEIVEQKKKRNWYETTTLRKVTKLLFSLSLFSFLFTLPSWVPFHFHSLFHSPNLHYSSATLRFHLFNQPIDKNCMFLLCNGLLVFLANYSGLFKTLSTSRRNYDSFKVYDQFGPSISYTIILEADKPSLETETPKITATTQQNDHDESEDKRMISEPESGDHDQDQDQDEDNYRGLRASFFAAERAELSDDYDTTADDDHQEGNNYSGVLSDEELNKKFDEFIKRMKEEIIVDDAPRTLVVV